MAIGAPLTRQWILILRTYKYDWENAHFSTGIYTVHHTPVEKIIQFFVSIISDCPDIKTVDNRLVPDKLAAAAWCQKQFADQSWGV